MTVRFTPIKGSGWSICNACGAVVADEGTHRKWHKQP